MIKNKYIYILYSIMSKFLTNTEGGSVNTADVKKIILNELIDPNTNKIYSNFINTGILSGIVVYNSLNYTTLLGITTMIEGDFAILNSGEIYIYDNTLSWTQINVMQISLNLLTNVLLNSLENNNILKYDSVSDKWKNARVFLSELEDASISNMISNKDLLSWNSSSNVWLNTAINSSYLSDFTLSGITNGQYLRYDANTSKWTNQNSDPISLSTLTDILLVGVSNKQALVYDSVSSKWKNTTLSLSHINDIQLSGSPLTNNTLLRYNTSLSKYTNQTINLSTNSDVLLTSPINGNILKYSSPNWTNAFLNFNDLSDVTITSALDGQFIIRNNGEFKNLKFGLYSNLLEDVSITTQLANQTLIFINGTSRYENRTLNLTYNSDVALNTPVVKNLLRYNGTQWINGFASLSEMVDCSISSPINNDALTYDSSINKWKNFQKTWIGVGSSRSLNVTDFKNNILYITAAQSVDITFTIPILSGIIFGSYCDVYNPNYNTIEIKCNTNNTINGRTNYITNSKFFTIFLYDETVGLYIIKNATNDQYQLKQRITSSVATNFIAAPYSKNYVYITTDNKYMLINNYDSNGRRYKRINLNDLTTATTSYITLPYGSNFIQDTTFYYTIEYNNTNSILMIKLDFVAASLSTTMLSTAYAGVSQNIINNGTKICIPYVDSLNIMKILTYQFSNNNIGTINSNINIGSNIKIISGWHKRYGIIITIGSVLSITQALVVDDFTSNTMTTANTYTAISSPYTDITYINHDDVNDEMYFILYNTSITSICKLTADKKNFIILDTFNIVDDIFLSPAYKLGTFIYIIFNKLINSNYVSHMIKYNVFTSETTMDYNVFNKYTQTTQYAGYIYGAINKLLTIGYNLNSQLTTALLINKSNIF